MTPKSDSSFTAAVLSVATDRAKVFYDAVLGTLGAPAGVVERHRIFWRTKTGVFSASLPIDGHSATISNGSTVGFACTLPEQVQAWHAAELAHGGTTCEEPPGPRGLVVNSLFLACLRDPDGNKRCGLFRGPKV